MKKYLYILLCLFCVLLVACNTKNNEPTIPNEPEIPDKEKPEEDTKEEENHSKKLIFTCPKDDVYAIKLKQGQKLYLE